MVVTDKLVEQQMPRIRLVGMAAIMTELLVWMHEKQAQLVVLDSHLPGMPLMTMLNLLLSQQQQLKVIILADYDEQRSELFKTIEGVTVSAYRRNNSS